MCLHNRLADPFQEADWRMQASSKSIIVHLGSIHDNKTRRFRIRLGHLIISDFHPVYATG